MDKCGQTGFRSKNWSILAKQKPTLKCSNKSIQRHLKKLIDIQSKIKDISSYWFMAFKHVKKILSCSKTVSKLIMEYKYS